MNTLINNLRDSNKELIEERKAAKKEAFKYKAESIAAGEEVVSSTFSNIRNRKRSDARYVHIAYSLLRGNKYKDIERTTESKVNPWYLKIILERYCDNESDQFDIVKIQEMLSE